MSLRICRSLYSLAFKTFPHLHKSVSPCSFSVLHFSTSIPKITVFDYLVNHQQFSREYAAKVPSAPTKYIKDPVKTDSILAFLRESGFSGTQIEKIVKTVPRLLNGNLEGTMKPKFDLFQDLGFDRSDVIEIVSKDPFILTRSADNSLRPTVLALKSVLGSIYAVSRLLKLSSWFLKRDLEKTMMPNIEFLESCGVSSEQIVTFLFNFPRFFLASPQSMKTFVERVDEMGLNRESKMFLSAVRVMHSMTMENWERKLQLFRNLGFSEENILMAFKRAPQAFAVSERKIKEVTQLLLGTNKADLSIVISHPELLLCSVQRRLKPRLAVVYVLERKKLLKRKPSLLTICKFSEQMFSAKYVAPYSEEVAHIYVAARDSRYQQVL